MLEHIEPADRFERLARELGHPPGGAQITTQKACAGGPLLGKLDEGAMSVYARNAIAALGEGRAHGPSSTTKLEE